MHTSESRRTFISHKNTNKMKNKFLTTVSDGNDQIMYAYTATREQGILHALGYISTFSMQDIKDRLTINQIPNPISDSAYKIWKQEKTSDKS